MTFTSVAQANSKTAEFARLFDLFDRVASRRTRALTGDTSEVISADDIANVPAEFAPVLKNLSTILSLRARRVQTASTTEQCHNTTTSALSTTFTAGIPTSSAGTMEPLDEAGEDAEGPTFPLGERYPFTFKLMLHKLYDLDEWVEKVKDAVETSRSQFKPLAERVQSAVRDATRSNKERGERIGSVRPILGASAKFKPPITRHPRSGAIPRDATTSNKDRAEKRNSPRPVLGASAKFKPSSAMRRPRSAAKSSEPETSRVVKKRCIGRRKSINGPISAGVWVYDAAISAMEVTGPCPAVEITFSTCRNADGAVENRARHRSLTENMQPRNTARRKVKITVPLLRQEVTESVLPPPSSVPQEFVERESVVKRRRSLAPVFTPDSCTRVAVKRPLCV